MAGTITIAREITVEPEIVWGVLSDIDRAPKVLTAVISIRRLDGPPGFEVGTRYSETRLSLGSHVTQEFTVTEVVPGHRATVEADIAGGHLKIQYRVLPSSLGTRLEANLSLLSSSTGIGQKIASTVSGGRAVKIAREMLEQDLKDIAAALRK
ncbi:MAG: SRPBCC family protein [Demequinaceae bacterium]|nr:SRPBCC family protein [Demequinaceae bacterium]